MNERTIFLLDGIGAALSFVFTGLILPHFKDALGLSEAIIYALAGLPAVYMLYSFCCFSFSKVIQGWMLTTIILANLVYCMVSGSLILFHDDLTDLGKYLLFAEILIVIGVIALELRVYRKFLRTGQDHMSSL